MEIIFIKIDIKGKAMSGYPPPKMYTNCRYLFIIDPNPPILGFSRALDAIFIQNVDYRLLQLVDIPV